MLPQPVDPDRSMGCGSLLFFIIFNTKNTPVVYYLGLSLDYLLCAWMRLAVIRLFLTHKRIDDRWLHYMEVHNG